MRINFEITEFTAICPFSDFPDFAVIRLEYVPNERCIELKSLKLYINSFRQVKIFHEHVTNLILEDFVRACDPLRVQIEGDFTCAVISKPCYVRGMKNRKTGSS
jgi:7-cyano-7-deazaguanine reductase